MTSLALGLTLLSVLLHASWNLISKRQRPGLSFFARASVLGVVPAIIVILPWQWRGLLALPWSVWGWVALTGFAQCVYLTGLAGAYRSGGMAQSYPLIRALPVLLLAILVPLLFGSGWPPLLDWLGFVLVVGGLLLLAGEGPVAWGWVLLAASGTMGYTLIDAHLLGALQLHLHIGPLQAGWVCMLLQGVATAFWTLLGSTLERHRHPVSLGAAAATGIMMLVTYGLVLCAFALVDNVAYVVAFRQLSIPLGMVMAVLFLSERPARQHWYAMLPLLAGLWLLH